jgi:hypothetical protein
MRSRLAFAILHVRGLSSLYPSIGPLSRLASRCRPRALPIQPIPLPRQRTPVRAMRNAAGKTIDKRNLPSKDCITCGRPFTWRKKWENCWDEVTCCSKRCTGEEKGRRRAESRGADDNAASETSEEPSQPRRKRGESAEERRARKNARKAAESALEEDDTRGMKACDGCGRLCDVLVRCSTVASGSEWLMLCTGRCWKEASGGVVGEKSGVEGYRYGGMWKNHHKEGVTARMPRAVKAAARSMSGASTSIGGCRSAEEC